MFDRFKDSMKKKFDMTDLGRMRYFLGVEVVQGNGGIFICQKKYAQEILQRFQMQESKPVKTPIVAGTKLSKNDEGKAVDNTIYKQIIGSLMYLTATRPDIAFAVSYISRFMENPVEKHLMAAKRIMRYVQGTIDYGILYRKGGADKLEIYSDSDYAGDQDDRRSTSGYVFLLSSGAVSWCSRKQPVVTLSTTEAEFIAAAVCVCQGIWLSRILDRLGVKLQGSLTILCDNTSTIKLSKNPVMHGRSKHIDVRFHFLRELSRQGKIKLEHCTTQNQTADIMTKALKLETFEKLRNHLGMHRAAELN